MKEVLTFLSVISVTFLFSQPLPEWTSNISNDFDWYLEAQPIVKFDNNGDIVLAANILNNNADILIAKYQPSGVISWMEIYNGPSDLDDRIIDFTINSANEIILTGSSFTDTLTTDALTIKYDSGGNFKWENLFNGSQNQLMYFIE